MKLVVLDPGFHWLSGHHYSVNELIRAECLARGLGWELHASRHVPAQAVERLGARPSFRFSPYAQSERAAVPELLEAQLFATGNAMTFEDLQAAKPALAPDDVLLVHTIAATQILGLAAWHARLLPPRPRLGVVLRFPPDFHVPEDQRPLAHAHFVHALAALARTEAALGADSAPLARLAERHWPRPVAILPIPLAPPDPVPPDTSGDPGQGLHIVYLGEARPEKGFDLLAPVIAAVLRRHPAMRFTIQCVACPTEPLQRIAAGFAGISPAIRVGGEALGMARYHELIASAHGVLVAYDPAAYTYRTSHVFIDALAQGKPVVTTAGSWMAAEAASLGDGALGPVMADFTADALARALDELAVNYPHYAAGAGAVAPVVRARHNRRAYLDTLLALLGVTGHG